MAKNMSFMHLIKNNLFEKPLTIILKEEIYEKKGINIGNTDSINELIKAIYRELR